MSEIKFLQIGELAKICNLSVQALRYYDKIDFIKPDYIDEDSKYRYYHSDKIFLIEHVKLLQQLGFSIQEVQGFLQKQTISDVTELYQKKLQQVQSELHDLETKKEQLHYYLDFFNSLLNPPARKIPAIGKMKLEECELKSVAFIRDTVKYDYPSLMLLYNQLLHKIFTSQTKVQKNIITIFHGGYNDIYHMKADIELALQLQPAVKKPQDKTFTRSLKSGLFVTCIHKGKYPSSITTVEKMQQFAKKKQLAATTPIMHELLYPIAAGSSENDTIFKIYLPLKKQ